MVPIKSLVTVSYFNTIHEMWEPSSHRDTGLLVLVYKCLHGLAPSHLADELRPPAVWGVCVPLRLTNCLFPVPDSQPTATELFQLPLYRSISHLLRQFLSSAVAWRHTSSNSVTRNYCCRAREVTLSFMDTLITLTYLLVHKALDSRPIFMALASNVQALEARAAVALTIFWPQTHPQT